MADCLFPLEKLKEIADNDVEYQLLKAQINQGFPQNKHDLSNLLHPYWNVREDLLVSDDGFVLKGTAYLFLMNYEKAYCQICMLVTGGSKAQSKSPLNNVLARYG